MDEYEATFSGDGQYITERRWPFPEHTYEIVNAVPLGYTVWNIGHPVAGEYLPLCRLSQHQPFPGGQSIDVDSLKANGLTDFADDGSVAVFVKPSLEVADAVEVLAHELAHVAVGVEHDHDEVWQEAFDKIFEEYNRIGNQMFPDGEDSAMDDPDEK